MDTPDETTPEPYKSIFNKLPYEGDRIEEDVFKYVGKHGGFITDGNLKHHYMQNLSDEERHLLAEYMGLERFVREDGKLQWNWDLQSDQSVEARARRFDSGRCPIHGIRFAWHSGPGEFNNDGVFDEYGGPEQSCPYCPHCATKSERPLLYIMKCRFCPVLAYEERKDEKSTYTLLPEFKYLLESSTPLHPAQPPPRAEVIPIASHRRVVMIPTQNSDNKAG